MLTMNCLNWFLAGNQHKTYNVYVIGISDRVCIQTSFFFQRMLFDAHELLCCIFCQSESLSLHTIPRIRLKKFWAALLPNIFAHHSFLTTVSIYANFCQINFWYFIVRLRMRGKTTFSSNLDEILLGISFSTNSSWVDGQLLWIGFPVREILASIPVRAVNPTGWVSLTLC